MNVVIVMVTTQVVQIVLVYQMVMPKKINVVYVMVLAQMLNAGMAVMNVMHQIVVMSLVMEPCLALAQYLMVH